MSEKEQQAAQLTNGNVRTGDARELRRKKRNKCFLYIALFVVFQTGIITLFALTVMKFRTPKFRVTDASITNFNAGPPANPSLRATMSAEFSVKNTNFGRYKYNDTTVEFFYGVAKVGEVLVPKSRANWRSTRKFRVEVDLNLGNGLANSQLSRDLSVGRVTITSSAKMSGKVELMYIMKKNKSTHMNCSTEIVTATKTIGKIKCK